MFFSVQSEYVIGSDKIDKWLDSSAILRKSNLVVSAHEVTSGPSYCPVIILWHGPVDPETYIHQKWKEGCMIQSSPLFVTPNVDEDDLLLDPEDWDQGVARFMADRYGIQELNDDHWRVIEALRNYYSRFGVAPAMISVCRAAGKERHWVQDLFGSCLNAWRVAGLPNPGEEAKTYLSDGPVIIRP